MEGRTSLVVGPQTKTPKGHEFMPVNAFVEVPGLDSGTWNFECERVTCLNFDKLDLLLWFTLISLLHKFGTSTHFVGDFFFSMFSTTI